MLAAEIGREPVTMVYPSPSWARAQSSPHPSSLNWPSAVGQGRRSGVLRVGYVEGGAVIGSCPASLMAASTQLEFIARLKKPSASSRTLRAQSRQRNSLPGDGKG